MISLRDRSAQTAANVALITFNGLVDPRHFVSRSRIPNASATARTVAPAITPVPGLAGISITLEDPNFPMTMCGMLPRWRGTATIRLPASLTAFSTASGTSFPLPYPYPTLPELSPTTTSAVKLNRRPPFTTHAQRRICTTFSCPDELVLKIFFP